MNILDRLRKRFPNDNISVCHSYGKNILTFNDRIIEVMWYSGNDITKENEIFNDLVSVIKNV